jgi:hypothetical protein
MKTAIRNATFLVAVVVAGAPKAAAQGLTLRVPAVSDPASPVVVHLELTSSRPEIASIGARLTYNPAAMTLSSIQKGAGVPASWSFIFQDTAPAGEADIVLTDQTAAAAVIAGPVTNLEVARLTFTRIGVNCSPAAFAFNAAAPDPGPPASAFPKNRYVIYLQAGQITLEEVPGTGASGPATADHRFIRGNVNNRPAHALDIGDLVDLVNNLFGGFTPPFDCAGAFDVNNDGSRNILDAVALVQGVFRPSAFTIPPPNAANPGAGIPGRTGPDGGSIPSTLGCVNGEACP